MVHGIYIIVVSGYNRLHQNLFLKSIYFHIANTMYYTIMYYFESFKKMQHHTIIVCNHNATPLYNYYDGGILHVP
jgi:hypothetical protein